jgi:hypothetical protein
MVYIYQWQKVAKWQLGREQLVFMQVSIEMTASDKL